MREKIDISVIIASYCSGKTIESCLESLERQKTSASFEIIVVESSPSGIEKLIEKRFPRVRIFKFSERKFPGDARNIGISHANGDIIAFLDADCMAAENWIEEIIRAYESPSLAIGGAIDNANPESWVGWAAYFCEFNKWMPGTPPGSMNDIAAANMSYKKTVFHKYGRFIERTYCSDTDLHWRLGENGHRLRFVPSIRIAHTNIDRMGSFLRHEFFHGRSFARVRVRSKNFTRLRRLIYFTLAPFIVFKLLLEAVLVNIKNRIYFVQFLKTFPLLITGLVFWSCGEAAGYAGK